VTDRSDETPAETPTARAATPTILACSGFDCGTVFKYGMIVVRPKDGRPLCENCAKKMKNFQGQAVVFGGQKPPTSVERDRAMRKLKKLDRMKKRVPTKVSP
jgi:hypothetical protein